MKLRFLYLPISVVVMSVFFQTAAAFADSYWDGAIEKDGKTWRVSVELKDEKAFVDFADVDAHGLEFKVEKTGAKIRLERPQPNGKPIVFDGEITKETFSGVWSGTITTATFSLKKSVKPVVFFREEEVVFSNGEVKLAGNLLLPIKGNKFTTVIFVHGSGPETRSPSRSLALKFVRRGFAALVYDKRGTGKSTGDFRSANMETLADDALAGLAFLKTRKEIDSRKIGVAGHSQGGWVAPLASVRSRDVAFVIASAASGVGPADQSIYHRAGVMREMGFSESEVEAAKRLRTMLYASGRLLLRNAPDAVAERRKVSAELEKYAKEPWFERGAELPPNLDNDNPPRGALELLFFEPEPMWRKVRVPVLLIWGQRDTVVPVAEGRAIIEKALRDGGNRRVTTKIFPNVNHGVVIVRDDKTWDFPRVSHLYSEAQVDWLKGAL